MKNKKSIIPNVILLLLAVAFVFGAGMFTYKIYESPNIKKQAEINKTRKADIEEINKKTENLSADKNIKKIEVDNINLDNQIAELKQSLGSQLDKVYSVTKLSKPEQEAITKQLGESLGGKLIDLNGIETSSGQNNSDEKLSERAKMTSYEIGTGEYDYITNTIPLFLNVNYESSEYDATPTGGTESREKKIIKHASNDFYTITYNLKSKEWQLLSMEKGDVNNV